VLGLTLDETDGRSAKTLRQHLQERGVKLVCGARSAVCLLACMTTTFAQSPRNQISILRWKVLLSGRVFPSIAQLTENTNVVPAINSTDSHGANKRASRGNGVVRLTSPTHSFTLVTEASFTSTGIKH
jgi:hypothetical protein